jgi:hypothetical protein
MDCPQRFTAVDYFKSEESAEAAILQMPFL